MNQWQQALTITENEELVTDVKFRLRFSDLEMVEFRILCGIKNNKSGSQHWTLWKRHWPVKVSSWKIHIWYGCAEKCPRQLVNFQELPNPSSRTVHSSK